MTERLANLSWQSVVAIVAVLFMLRWALLKQGGDFAKSIAEIAESLGIAMALVFFIIRPFLVQAFFIPSGSMHMTLLEDDHILVNKLGYRVFAPKTGDVVVFKAPPEASEDGQEKDYIKRLIGTPGDTIEVKSGELKIGGQQLRRADVVAHFIDPGDIGREVHVKYEKDGLLVNRRKVPLSQIARELGAPVKDIKIQPGRTILNGKVLDEPYTAEDPDYDYPKRKLASTELFVLGDNRNNSNDSHRWGPLERKRLLGKAMFIFWPINRMRIVH